MQINGNIRGTFASLAFLVTLGAWTVYTAANLDRCSNDLT
jgi:hypothetical protein